MAPRCHRAPIRPAVNGPALGPPMATRHRPPCPRKGAALAVRRDPGLDARPLLLLWPMSVLVTWLVAQNIANKPFDRELGEMARDAGAADHGADRRRRPPGGALQAAGERRRAAALRTRPTTSTSRCSGCAASSSAATGRSRCRWTPDPGAAGEVRFRDDVINNTAVRVAYLGPGRRRADRPGRRPGRRRGRWCRWPRRWASARGWPPRSSRA